MTSSFLSSAHCCKTRGCIFSPQSMRLFVWPSIALPFANLWYSIQRVRYGEAWNSAGDSVALMVLHSGSGMVLFLYNWRSGSLRDECLCEFYRFGFAHTEPGYRLAEFDNNGVVPLIDCYPKTALVILSMFTARKFACCAQSASKSYCVRIVWPSGDRHNDALFAFVASDHHCPTTRRRIGKFRLARCRGAGGKIDVFPLWEMWIWRALRLATAIEKLYFHVTITLWHHGVFPLNTYNTGICRMVTHQKDWLFFAWRLWLRRMCRFHIFVFAAMLRSKLRQLLSASIAALSLVTL